ncbi:MAG: glycosyltransferase [Sphingobacteriales bacterium]|nr:MAG: glycosyltransferase [Sphingobacteriales bacterium]
MSTPLVSILIPVYNTAAYLTRAIQSILEQQYPSMEIILINDGSTDASETIIQSFQDPRIRYVKNEQNLGLVYTLNKGIDLSAGKYIARMDGDDMCLPGRITQQVAYLEAHPEVGVLASRVSLINEMDKPIGNWAADEQNTTPEQIRGFLPKDNCLAHPSIMAKAEMLKKYKYRSEQSQAEDYDLWLRMAADGVVIHKLPDELVQHRIVHNSFTRSRQQNVFKKLAKTKFRFVGHALSNGRWNGFVWKTLGYACMDQLKAIGKTLKKSI